MLQRNRPALLQRSNFRTRAVAALLSAALPLLAAGAEAAPARTPERDFDQLVDEYYLGYLRSQPTAATGLGIHDYDDQLEDMSAAGRVAQTRRLESFLARFGKIHAAELPPGKSADLALVQSAIKAALLETQGIQGWKHHAQLYTSLGTESVYALIKRAFAPEAERLQSVILREEKIPALLAQAKENLDAVPRVNLEMTLEELPGTVDFFRVDVPKAFPSVLGAGAAQTAANAGLKSRFDQASAAAIASFEDYGKFLREKLLPSAKPEFAIGERLFLDKLRDEEMIDLPLDALLARGEKELLRLEDEFKKTAARIDPKKPIAEVQAGMTADHPTPARVIPDVQARLAGLRKFLVDQQIVTVPSEVMPKVEETPPFMRSFTLASMFTPGPFETRATEAMYNVTLPDPAWKPEVVEDFLRGAYSRPLIDVVSIHEAFPGHYVQFLWLPQVKSKVRKFESVSSNAEGWAHYCEQMLLDEGWGKGDDQLRLGQLQDALLRAARYVVGIRMHTKGMTLDEAQAFFEQRGHQSKQVSSMEARRGTIDPTYLYYTFGKLEILRLREDYKKKLGKDYSLKQFHDRLLAEGAIPLPLLRKALLGEGAAP